MELIKLGVRYVEDMIENSKKIEKVAEDLHIVCKSFDTNDPNFHLKMACLFINIHTVLDNWTGYSYIGIRKKKILQDAFQSFFDEFYSFLLKCRSSDNEDLKSIANEALYQGVIYRYIGHGMSKDSKKKIILEYNDTWVSWSKNKSNKYIEQKLYGTKIHITSHTDEKIYGIDLSVFGVSLNSEKEIVYPTIKDNIDDIQYMK